MLKYFPYFPPITGPTIYNDNFLYEKGKFFRFCHVSYKSFEYGLLCTSDK